MDDERLVVEVENYVELYDQSSRHYKDNSKKVIAWRAIALEIGSSGDFLHLYCSAAVAPPPVGARGVLLTRVKCAPCRCGASGGNAYVDFKGLHPPPAQRHVKKSAPMKAFTHRRRSGTARILRASKARP
ncbi:unnamed protein product [Boreogadus saida]